MVLITADPLRIRPWCEAKCPSAGEATNEMHSWWDFYSINNTGSEFVDYLPASVVAGANNENLWREEMVVKQP